MKILRIGVLLALMLTVVGASAVIGQRPSVSVESGIFSIKYEACLERARQSLIAEGFVAERGGGNFYWGGKAIHHATIVCDGTPHPDGKIDFHVFVTSNTNDGNLAGGERVKLTNRMYQTLPDPKGLSVKTQKQVYAANEQIVVEYSGLPGSQTDWFTIVKVGAADNTYGQFEYSGGKRFGTHTFTGLPPGQYEVRIYFNWQAGGYVVHARHQFTVQ